MDKGQKAEASSCWSCAGQSFKGAHQPDRDTGQSFKGAHQPDREEGVPHIFKGKAKQIKETGMVSVILMFLGGVITVGALFLMAQVLLFLQDVDEER